MKTALVVIGAGGHCRELLDAVEALDGVHAGFEVLGVVAESWPLRERLEHRGVELLGGPELLDGLDARFVVAIGDGATRRRFDALCCDLGLHAATVVHPRAELGRGAVLGEGCYIASGARVMADAALGRHVHVNVGAVVSHDSVVGDFSTLSPGTLINGTAAVGEGVFFGTGSIVLPGCTIGDGAVIGAGAVVTGDVPEHVTAVGVPASWDHDRGR